MSTATTEEIEILRKAAAILGVELGEEAWKILAI